MRHAYAALDAWGFDAEDHPHLGASRASVRGAWAEVGRELNTAFSPRVAGRSSNCEATRQPSTRRQERTARSLRSSTASSNLSARRRATSNCSARKRRRNWDGHGDDLPDRRFGTWPAADEEPGLFRMSCRDACIHEAQRWPQRDV